MSTEKKAHIQRLTVRNFKGCELAQIDHAGEVVAIKGRNGAGKSSVLDAIQALVGGKRNHPTQMLKQGAVDGEVEGHLTSGVKIRLKIKNNGDGVVSLLDPDGNEIKKPQTVLDTLYRAATFDPMSFLTLKPAEQAETLRKIAGLDLSGIENARKRTYDERAEWGRMRDRHQAELQGLPASFPGVPDEEVSVQEAAAAVSAAMEFNGKVDNLGKAHAAALERLLRIDNEIKELLARLDVLRQERASTSELAEEMRTTYTSAIRPSVDAAKKAMADLGETNKKVQLKKRRRALEAQVTECSQKYADLTAQIEKADTFKASAIAKAPMPVKGLGFLDDGAVSYDGIAFDQVNRATQMRVSVAIAAALAPDLAVALVRDGSLLDSEQRKVLTDLCHESGLQLWLEQVVDDDTKAEGLVIRNGVLSEK